MGPHSTAAKRLQKKYPGKFCCHSGKCAGDNSKCGFGLDAVGAVLPGVALGVGMSQADHEHDSGGT